MWIAFCDFQPLGLKNKSKATFTSNLDKVLNRAKYYGCNTIYWHARAFDDATWASKTFKASAYLDSDACGKTAARTYSYDPLAIVIQECRERGLKIEAWLNPYRITYSNFLNPKSTYSTYRINRAVNELQAYDLDGIHFDDYFYHSSSKYTSPSSATRYSVYVKGSTTKSLPSSANKRAYVNKMVKSVYKNVHQIRGDRFGISPAGNVENCMADGADVKTWMSKSGYIDYIAPQIYWTDNWGYSGRTKMYSNRLAQWKSLNKRNVDMYIGLALYRTGIKASDDRGWAMRITNLRTQVKKMRSKNLEGYILFEASDLYRSKAKGELYKLKGLVYPKYAKSITISSGSSAWIGKGITTKVIWNPSDTNPKSVTYTTSNSRVATVSKSGVVKGKLPGRVTITAKAKKGAQATKTLTVKPCKVKVSKRYTAARTGAGSKYRIVTRFIKGKTFYVNRSKGNWGRVKGTSNWVYLKNTARVSR